MLNDIVVRQMKMEDIDRVCQIEKACFYAPWSRRSFEEELSGNSPAFYIVAEIEGEIVGYGGIWHILDEGHITNVAVHPDFRKRGIGMILVKSIMTLSKKMGITSFTLEVRESNEDAINLYLKNGFQLSGRRRNYYEEKNGREDALIFWLRDV